MVIKYVVILQTSYITVCYIENATISVVLGHTISTVYANMNLNANVCTPMVFKWKKLELQNVQNETCIQKSS